MRRSLAVLCAFAVGPAASAQDAAQAVDTVRFALRAVDSDGRPLEGVCVARLDSKAHAIGGELARSGADGHLEVALEVPRSIEYESFVPLVLVIARAGRASVAVPAATFPPQHRGRGPRVELGDIPMPSGVTLRGVVRDQAGAPLADALVEAIDAMCAAVHGVGDDEALTPFLLVASPYSLARSDANGRFELRGALPAGACVVATKPGHAASIATPVAVGDRLELTMVATGFARGVVVDREGNGVAEYLALIDEFGNQIDVRSEADGRFEMTLPSRGRWTVGPILALMVGDDVRRPDETWHRGTRDEVRIAAHAREDGAAALVVRVIDDAGGEPIDAASAGVGWHEFFQQMIASAASATALVHMSATARGGEATLDGPREGEDHKGVVVATAPGHAPQHAPIEWSEDGARVELRLVAEAVLRGVVVDEVSGAPIAGALVEAARPSAAGAFAGVFAFQSGYAPASDQTLSTSRGRFELRAALPSARRSRRRPPRSTESRAASSPSTRVASGWTAPSNFAVWHRASGGSSRAVRRRRRVCSRPRSRSRS
ncbi:MAG: carboxypeptidase regulatory-like domain-containing protein [Planctomycetes bacterium]|nr:carboxypeptidase regulatory-like domain-containing protein [Planctomycetota bacterium]